MSACTRRRMSHRVKECDLKALSILPQAAGQSCAPGALDKIRGAEELPTQFAPNSIDAAGCSDPHQRNV